MKSQLIAIVAAVFLAGCGESLRERAAKVQDSSIHSDVNEGNIEAVKEYLAAGGDVNAKHDMLGLQLTPLYVAASQGYKEISELLIANGADVNPKDENVMAPLNAAAELGHKEVVELLIAKGADVNGDMGGSIPLDVSMGTLLHTGKRDLEIVMLVSVLVFAATWYINRKQLPAEGADDEPPQAN